MKPTITPLKIEVLSALQALSNRQLAPHFNERLAPDMQDAARGHGTQTVLAWRGDQVVGCAGWVTLGIAADGCAYGSPVVASDVEVASLLIQSVMAATRKAQARRLRISARAPEYAKHEALAANGFGALFEFVNFSLPLSASSPPALPAGLHEVPFEKIDWRQAHVCYADTFAGVQNSPCPEIDVLRAEWGEGDWKAGRILADERGEYQAFSLVCANNMDAIGVRSGWRGRNVAAALYQFAAASLAAKGCSELRALVAGNNAASMRLHQKLGFVEAEPRWTVYEITL